MKIHHYQDLITLFNDLYKESEETILINGGEDPIYLPKNESSSFNQIIFQENYFASALHEIAHWCIAGKERRKLVDYGYQYQPNIYSTNDRNIYEKLETKPQAIEWIFCLATGTPFYVSIGDDWPVREINPDFRYNIYQQAIYYFQHGLPRRAEQFKQILLKFYKREEISESSVFRLEDLL